MFGTGLKLIYRDKIGDYVEKTICGILRNTHQLIHQKFPRTQYKDSQEWLLSNLDLYWPP